MKNRLVLLTICLFAAAAGRSQNYWRACVDTVSAPGYYNIELSQEMAGRGLRTLRLRDAEGAEIPYLIRSSAPVREMERMEMYEQLSHEKRDSTNTIVLLNKDPEVSRFYLRMKQADVAKYVSIRGSYDRQQWFSVKQRTRLGGGHTPDTDAIAVIDFPAGDYTYYELTVTNSSRNPLNIIGVGKIENSTVYGRFTELNTGAFRTEEEDGSTIVTFPALQQPYLLSKLEIHAGSKGHFSRRMRLETGGYAKESFQFSSRQEQPFFYTDDLPIGKDFRLVIENGDNPPLQIDQVKLFGLDRYLCAYLDAGVRYRIETGTEEPRRYDIRDFADEIPHDLPVIRTGNTEEATTTPEPEKIPKFYERPVFMWSVIILTGIILLFVCLRMAQELKKRQE